MYHRTRIFLPFWRIIEGVATARSPWGKGSVFQVVKNGRKMWCASKSYMDGGKRRFIRRYGDEPDLARGALHARILQRATHPTTVKPLGLTVTAYLEVWME